MTIPDTRISLLHRLHDRQDTAAWTEFCAIYERAIYRIALKYGLQDADAREVSQEVLLTVSRKIRNFDPQGKGRFRAWLSTVARNATIDLLRRNRRVLATGDSELQRGIAEQVDPSEEQSLFDIETRREQFCWAAEQVRRSVSESTWLAFWRTAIKGESPDKTAKELKMTVGTVYVARCRTLAKIKKLVEPFCEDEL